MAALLFFSGGLGAQDSSIPRDGFSLYYRTEGSGKPIIFLSGGPGLDVDYMRPAAELFPSEYQRVFLEQRGTGRSRPARLTAEHMSLRLAVEDLEVLRNHLKLDRLLLAGHSWGGMLAMAYASFHPENVDRLILIDSGGPTKEFQQWFQDNIEMRLLPEEKEARQKSWSAAEKGGMDADDAAQAGLRATTPAFFFDRAKGLAFASQMPKGAFHRDANALMNAETAKSYDVRDGLREVTRPVLIIQGHQDPIGDKTAEDIHRLIRSSVLRYLDRCGHFPWVEQPDKMRAVVAEFLKSDSASASRAADPVCQESPADRTQVVEAVRTMYAALTTDNLNLFHSVASKDFYAYDGGKRFDGDALMNAIKALHAAGRTYVWTVNEPEVHISCGTAWITYVNKGSMRDASGVTPLKWLESAVLRQDSGRWRIHFFHSTRVQ
jgi:proline iminopeptidase